MSNSFESFADLPLSLQSEAIREGEKLLDTQFVAATAADQRALTWSGFLIASATAAFGGGIALFKTKPPDIMIGFGALAFSVALLRSAWLAIKTVRPSKFGFPGNQPAFWLPAAWDCLGTSNRMERQARIDQARQLDERIRENAESAAEKAKIMSRSFDWAIWSTVGAGLLLAGLVTERSFHIFDGVTKIIKHISDGPSR